MDDHTPHAGGHGHGHGPGEQESVLDLDAEVFGAQLAEVLDLVPVTTPRHVVDLGAGTGTGTRLLRRRFPEARVTAVDNAPEMLARLRGEGFDVLEADLDLGFPALGDVDLVWASSSMHHVTDPAALFAGARSVLTPDGVLVVLELEGLPRFLASPGFEDQAHAAAAAAGWNRHPDWQPLLEAAGFSVHRTSLTTTAPDGPSARRYARAWFERFSQGFGMSLDGVPVEFAPRASRTVWIARAAR